MVLVLYTSAYKTSIEKANTDWLRWDCNSFDAVIQIFCKAELSIRQSNGMMQSCSLLHVDSMFFYIRINIFFDVAKAINSLLRIW